MTVTVKQGDTHDTTWTANADLTGSTVRLLAKSTSALSTANPIVLATTVTDAANGVVTHTLTGTLESGTYNVELEVTASSGKISTFPSSGHETLNVIDDL